MRDALALLYEKDADIKMLTEQNLALGEVISKKDVEIEGLTTELQATRGAANSLKMHLEAVQDEFFDYQADVQTDIAYARADAITEFAERAKKRLPVISPSVFDQITKEMKEEKEKGG